MTTELKTAAVDALGRLGFSNQIQIVDGQPYSSLASGYKIPLFGLGTWSGGPNALDRGLTYAAVKEAIKQGYRHIDCAYAYKNEDEVGQALQECFKEGLIKREDLFVTTKLFRNFMEPNAAKKVFEEQRQALQLDYLDLYIIHSPAPTTDVTNEGAWKALEELVGQKKIRSIGVSNFSIKKCQDLQKHAKLPISVNQVEVHPYWNNKDLIDWSQKNNIHITAYSPLGASSSDSNRLFKLDPVLDDPIIKSISQKYNAQPGQVALRWGLQRGLSVVPKSTNPKRIKENFESLNLELTTEDVEAITAIKPQVRALRFQWNYGTPGSPYKSYEDFWDEADSILEYLKKTGQEQVLENAKKEGKPF